MTKRVFLSPPHMGGVERDLLLDAFDSNWVAPLGPFVDRFERDMIQLLGVRSAAALSSGTAAIHLALMILGVGRGDGVICSSFTFAATANPIAYVGAEPIFIDSDEATWNMDPDLLREELQRCARQGKIPKAVIVVDLYGQCADYDRILTVCAEYDVPVIEDAAEALGSTYKGKSAGSFGMMGVLSFNGNKIITTGGGGMLLSENEEYTKRARFLATQARDPEPHYEHTEIGYNYRLSNLLAAVGVGQLQYLKDRVAARRRIFERYTRTLGALPGIGFMPEASYGRSNRWLTCITIDPARFGATREHVRRALDADDIEARPLWKPMHLQPVFAGCRMRGGTVSQRLFERGLCLPSGTAMDDNAITRVENIVRRSAAVATR